MFSRVQHFFFFFLFLLGIFLPSTFIFANTLCVCTDTAKDCQATSLDTSKQSTAGCEATCKKNLGETKFVSSEYAQDVAADALNYKCNQTHDAYKAGLTSAPPAPPKALITPTLNVEIPGLTFSAPTTDAISVKSSFLAEYINAIYAFLISVGIIVAIIMIMVGGLQYTIGAASSAQVGKGKDRIKNAVTGLVLLFCVFLVLKTTNPQLVTMNMVTLQNIQFADLPVAEEEADVDPGAVRVCDTVESCTKLCASDQSTWPKSNSKIVDPSEVSKVPSALPGFVNDGGNGDKGQATDAMQAALKKAGEIATAMNSSYTIHLVSGYRSMSHQIQLVCDKINSGNADEIKKIGHSVAWPGGSNHGSGTAADLVLMKNGVPITDPSLKVANQSNPKYKDGAQVFTEIMTKAGMVRYGAEIWHFELPGTSYCRCSFPSCPFPPKC